MLDSYENRKGHMLAFGLVANSVISVVFGQNKEMLGHYLSSLIETGLKDYPFLGSKFHFY